MPTLTPIDVLVFLTSVIFPMFGQGGGVVYVPLFWLKGFSFYSAVAISQSLIFVSSLSAMITYHRAGMISWPLFLLVELPTMVGAFVGGRLSSFIPVVLARTLFSVFVFFSGLRMFRSGVRSSEADGEFSIFSHIRTNVVRMGLGVGGMFLAGIVAGLLGIGGGVIKVPLMILFMRIPARIAVGTSGLMVGLTALSGLLGHAQSGHLPSIKFLWPYWILVFVGAQVGSRIGRKLSSGQYRRYLGLLLMFLSILFLLISFFSNKI